MRKRGGKPAGPFSVQIVKGRRLSNDLANRLNDYRHTFPRRQIIAVNVLPMPDESNLGDGPGADTPVVYEIVWEEPPK